MSNTLTIDEVCERLKIEKSTLYKWWQRGEGPPYTQVGALRRVLETDLDKWLQSNKPGNEEQ